MSTSQEQEIKALWTAAGKNIMLDIPEVMEAMRSWDPYVGDIKFIMLLQKINTNQQRQLIEDLRIAKQ